MPCKEPSESWREGSVPGPNQPAWVWKHDRPGAPRAASSRSPLELSLKRLLLRDVVGLYRGPDVIQFATRKATSTPLQTTGEHSLGDTDTARDLLKLGNVLFVASATGKLLALDVSNATKPGAHGEAADEPSPFARHALMDAGYDEVRALATDGHNRVSQRSCGCDLGPQSGAA